MSYEMVVNLPQSPFFVPPHTGGDRDFWGHGPISTMTATLTIEGGTRLKVRLAMTAVEDGGDLTRAEGVTEYVAFDAPPGHQITRILTDASSSLTYRDTDWEEDVLPSGSADELVNEFRAFGDTYGDEAGSRTGFYVLFNPVRIQVRRSRAGANPRTNGARRQAQAAPATR